MKEGCPEYCKINPQHILCKIPSPEECEKDENIPGCPVFCQTNPEHPLCKIPYPKPTPDDCTERKMRMGCPEFCKSKPEHPLCKAIDPTPPKPTPEECEVDQMKRGCPKYCETNPDDTLCNIPQPPTPEECEENPMKPGCSEFCKQNPKHDLCDKPKVGAYDSDNGKEIEDKPLDLEDDDPYQNPKSGELFSPCSSDDDCNDGVKAEDGTDSTLACQSGKCRLKPGEFCYPGNNYLDYTCFNKNPCMKRFVQREFRSDQVYPVYRRIYEMTPNKQQLMLNRFSMTLGRYQEWGVIDSLNMNVPEN